MPASHDDSRTARGLAETQPLPVLPPRGAPTDEATTPVRRRESTAPPARAVVMHLAEPGDITRVFDQQATVFVLMPDPPAEGSRVECVLVHPIDHSEVMVRADVIRVATTPEGTGVELRFNSPSEAMRADVMRFMHRGRAPG